MSEEIYESDGDITLCFEGEPTRGYGFISITIRQSDVSGVKLGYGHIFLDGEQNTETIPRFYNNLDAKIGLVGVFRRKGTSITAVLAYTSMINRIHSADGYFTIHLENVRPCGGQTDLSKCPQL